jgi:hypothetical protein
MTNLQGERPYRRAEYTEEEGEEEEEEAEEEEEEEDNQQRWSACFHYPPAGL